MYNTELLTHIGIRIPYVITAGHNDEGDFDYAIVECFKGRSLGDYMRNGQDISFVTDKIIAVMDRMAAEKRTFYGPPMGNTPNNISATQLVYEFTSEELKIASKSDDEVSDL